MKLSIAWWSLALAIWFMICGLFWLNPIVFGIGLVGTVVLVLNIRKQIKERVRE